MLEICCGSYEDALVAYQAGAKQIELNSALHLGGLTPSVSSLKLVLANTDLKVYCMVRARAGGFCYSEVEYIQMYEEAKDLLENGAHGIVFGYLNNDNTINIEESKKLISLIKSYNAEVIFHRAYDCVNDPYLAIQQLIDLGVERLLTSGLQAKALLGKDLLKDLQAKYGNYIQILQGSGVNASNVNELVNYTNNYNIHTSCKAWLNDPTTSTSSVSFKYVNNNDYEVVSYDLVKAILQAYKTIKTF